MKAKPEKHKCEGHNRSNLPTYCREWRRLAIVVVVARDVWRRRPGRMLEKVKQERKGERGTPTPPVTWCVNLFLQQSCIVRPGPVNLNKSEDSTAPTLPQTGWFKAWTLSGCVEIRNMTLWTSFQAWFIVLKFDTQELSFFSTSCC